MVGKQKFGVRLVYHGLVRAKKNSKRIIRNRRTGKMVLISSDAAVVSENDMILQFKTQRPRYDIPSPVRIHMDIYEPDRTRRDLDNQATSVLDALVRSGCIEDDSIKYVTELKVRLAGIDKHDPRAVVLIEYIGDENDN